MLSSPLLGSAPHPSLPTAQMASLPPIRREGFHEKPVGVSIGLARKYKIKMYIVSCMAQLSGAHYQENANFILYLCHGIFAERVTFRLTFPGKLCLIKYGKFSDMQNVVALTSSWFAE